MPQSQSHFSFSSGEGPLASTGSPWPWPFAKVNAEKQKRDNDDRKRQSDLQRKAQADITSFLALKTSLPINDRNGFFLAGFIQMARLEPDSVKRAELNTAALHILSLPPMDQDPLASPSSQPLKYPFRSVKKITGNGKFKESSESLPHSDRVFEEIFQGTDRKDHSNKLSGLLHSFGVLLSLTCFREDSTSASYNGTTPFLDLSPLYGDSKEQTRTIRTLDGRGTLLPDFFYDERLPLMTPPVVALLVLWNRNHNYIARHLLAANEKNRWKDPPPHLPEQQDNEIFDIARTINRAQFRNVVAEDVLKGLFGLENVGNSAYFDCLSGIKPVDTFCGAFESSFLYEWAAMMSEKDAKWFEQPDPSRASDVPKDPKDRSYRSYDGYFTRENGKIPDDEIAAVLWAAIDSPAKQPGGLSHLPITRIQEIGNIERGRLAGGCSLNDFREYLGLTRLKSWAEWNPDYQVYSKAEQLYRSGIDSLDLYPGLQAERALSSSGFGLGCTMSFALVVDMISRMRHDSDLAETKLTDEKITSWGAKECEPDAYNGSFRCMLPKLIFRNLHGYQAYNNIYALFPFTIPAATMNRLEELKAEEVYGLFPTKSTNGSSKGLRPHPGQSIANLYEYDRPKKFVYHRLDSLPTIREVFNNPGDFSVPYTDDMKLLTKGYGYMLGFDDASRHDADRLMTLYALMPDTRSFTEYADYFASNAERLIQNRSVTPEQHSGFKTIDIVKDVIIPTCTAWACECVCGVSVRDSKGELIPEAIEMAYKEFAAFHLFVFHKSEPYERWTVRMEAVAASLKLADHLDGTLNRLATPDSKPDVVSFFQRVFSEFMGYEVNIRAAQTFLSRLMKTNRTVGKFQDLLREGAFHPQAKGSTTESAAKLDSDKQKEGVVSAAKDEIALIGELAKSGADSSTAKKPESKRPPLTKEGIKALERQRLISNIVGLSVVVSINLAQACSHMLDFYLKDDHKKEKDEILKLIKSLREPGEKKLNSETVDKINSQIMGYLREAQRLSHPTRLYRVAEKTTKIDSHTVEKGTVVMADFSAAHLKQVHIFENQPPDEKLGDVVPSRQTHAIMGTGFHKCPGTSFVDKITPEIFRVIFELESMKLVDKPLRPFYPQEIPDEADIPFYLGEKGSMMPFPQSLPVQYTKFHPRKRWNTRRPSPGVIRQIMDACYAVIGVLSMLWKAYSWWPSPEVVETFRPAQEIFNCRPPVTIFQKWGLNTIFPGVDGQPTPIEYTLDYPKPHRLSVVDVDDRDMQLAVYVDGIMRGHTTDFELNKALNCGEDVNTCLANNFSAGVVVVPPGRHTVKLMWAGKEFKPGTNEIDWGGDFGRRLMWQLEHCS